VEARPLRRQAEMAAPELKGLSGDLRRRLEAAKNAGLDHIPVPPPPDPAS
jgi:hypothetical protein